MAACCHTGARSRSGVWIKHSLKAVMVGEEGEQLRICVVGAGTRFLSGISVYTYRLADSLAASNRVSVILMRQLLPSRLYPGRKRVGSDLTRLKIDDTIGLVDG